MVTALNGWLLAYDNLTTIPGWMSDVLCQLVFGGGFSGRALYSNDERSIIHAQRPVMVNGIEDFVRRGDLRDRCVFLQLPPILSANRRAENEFWRSFEADYPRILGGVLDLIVGALRALPSVHCPDLPRMADYARWGVALGRGLSSPSETFLAEYNTNRKNATATELEDSRRGNRASRRRGLPGPTLGGDTRQAARGTHRDRWQKSRRLGPLAQVRACFCQRTSPHHASASIARLIHRLRARA